MSFVEHVPLRLPFNQCDSVILMIISYLTLVILLHSFYNALKLLKIK